VPPPPVLMCVYARERHTEIERERHLEIGRQREMWVLCPLLC